MPGMIVIALVAFGGSWLLTWLVRRYALRRSVLDIPNERSSHVTATPRGGGLAIVLSVLGVAAWLRSRGLIEVPLAQALLVGGSAVALVGWLDDHRPLGVALRATVQLATAAWAVYLVGGVSELETGFGRLHLGIVAGSILATVGIAWLLNLFNFLDGTDGYAGTQAICTALAGWGLFLFAGEPGNAALCIAIGAAAAGFLVWNWSPARIFMGDVGSCFLGYVFGVLALFGEKSGGVPVYVWLILLGAFVWDATLTLIRRLLAGERWYDPHRTHAYQRLHQVGFSHRQIALLLLAVNVLLLWPLAYVTVLWNNLRPSALVASICCLVAAWILIQIKFSRHPPHRPA
ncbi:MAG: MraY family glycosyltransferase [Chromatiales bacterium]